MLDSRLQDKKKLSSMFRAQKTETLPVEKEASFSRLNLKSAHVSSKSFFDGNIGIRDLKSLISHS